VRPTAARSLADFACTVAADTSVAVAVAAERCNCPGSLDNRPARK